MLDEQGMDRETYTHRWHWLESRDDKFPIPTALDFEGIESVDIALAVDDAPSRRRIGHLEIAGQAQNAFDVFCGVALRAAEDVEDAFNQLVQSELRRNEIVVEIAALQKIRDRSQEAYEAGVIPLTEVLDASRQLLNARDNLATSREGMARAAVQSFRALGGGWAL